MRIGSADDFDFSTRSAVFELVNHRE